MMRNQPASSPPAPADRSWTEIEDLLDHLAQRAAEPVAPQQFFTELLDQSVPALAAVAGAVWKVNPHGPLELERQVNLPATEVHASEDARESHGQLLLHAIQQALPLAIPPESAAPGHSRNGQPQNPTELLILLCPVRRDGEVVGLLEIFQRPHTTAAAQQGFLRFLETLSEISADFYRHGELRELRDRAALWGQYEAFAQRVHGGLDVDRTAFVLANDGRGLIGCDRVSVLLVKGRRTCRVKAISGQDVVDWRANVVRRLEQLCAAVVRMDEPLWYHDDTANLPPQIESLLERYLDESHARMVAVVPLTDPEEEESSFRRARPFGALVAERFDADPEPETTRQRVRAVCQHGGAALRNALTHRNLPLFRLMKTLEGAAWYVRLKNLPKTLLVAGLLAALVAALVFVPADFTVSGEGELQPKIRRDVFAWGEGVVENVAVEHAQLVQKDQVLVTLRQTELDYEVSRVLGEQQTARARLASVRASTFSPPANLSSQEIRQRRAQLSAEESEVEELLKSLEDQRDILQQQRAELEIKSPLSGQVLTWDVGPLLEKRPVSRGQVLMTVADLSGPWVLEIRVPDDQVGHVFDARRESGEELTVEFLLATDPETTYTGTISQIAMTTETHEEHAASVLVTVSINRDDIADLRPGATVIPKIHCGRKSLGYVWFHGLIDAAKTYILF